MNWYDEVKLNLKKKRAILFSKSSECLLPLQSQLEDTDKRTAVLWSLYFAEDAVELVSARYPDESAPCDALALTKLWAQGKVKMPEAKRAILECHALAKRISSPQDIALCHAIGQACGCVHAKGHAIGFPVYELTAIVRRYGIEACKDAIERRLDEYREKLLELNSSRLADKYEWAKFLKSN